ncbi:unnamed protein product [Symbiodinium necroappetens]|uniref:Uncharacterized protein n=1 Tax=Symbiodinium necroappetens TaxID=1628268 RepID=A0A812VT00_9DINO|nr:unnamed protein product [Symbiodinium necroappetens]
MFEVAGLCRKKQAETPEQITCSLGVMMLRCLLQELSNRLSHALKSPEVLAALVKQEMVTDKQDWMYMLWDKDNGKLMPQMPRATRCPPRTYGKPFRLEADTKNALVPFLIDVSGRQDVSGYGGTLLWVCALAARLMSLYASLDKPASEVVDDASLAMYLWLRRIPHPRQFVADLGVRHYFAQYPSDADTTTQIRAQIYQELEHANLDVAITFFRHMLDQSHREDFYEDIYRHILSHMITEPRPITAMHPTLFQQPAQSSVDPMRVPRAPLTLESQVETQDDHDDLRESRNGCPSPAPTLIESSGSEATMDYGDSRVLAFMDDDADT